MFGKNDGSKMSGMEMMISSILKSMGVSPEMITAKIEDFQSLAGQFVNAMRNTNERMAAIEKQNAEILAILRRGDRIALPVGVTSDGSGNDN